jgi:hypothetical protein
MPYGRGGRSPTRGEARSEVYRFRAGFFLARRACVEPGAFSGGAGGLGHPQPLTPRGPSRCSAGVLCEPQVFLCPPSCPLSGVRSPCPRATHCQRVSLYLWLPPLVAAVSPVTLPSPMATRFGAPRGGQPAAGRSATAGGKPTGLGDVVCEGRLGGLLHHYRRAACYLPMSSL